MECLTQKLMAFTHLFSKKHSILDASQGSEYASGLLKLFFPASKRNARKVDICHTDYIIHFKLRIFPYSETIHGSTTFKLMKCSQRLKKNDQLLNLMFLFFHFLCSNVPDKKCHKQKWCVLFFTRIKLVMQVLECARAITRIKWRRLVKIFYILI